MRIRTMTEEDLDFAAARTTAEGWRNETREDFENFLAHDSEGCLIAEEEGGPIGIGVATAYRDSGFIGELIVLPERRGRGVGAKLLGAALEHLERRGVRSVLLDGVPGAVRLYERAGFRPVCRSLRFTGLIEGETHGRVRPMEEKDWDAVRAMDREAFGEDRSFFLRRRFERAPELCLVLAPKEEILGFVIGRYGDGIVSASPWIARPGSYCPADLLRALAREAPDTPIELGVLESNGVAIGELRASGFEEKPTSSLRMVRGPSGDLGAAPACFSIGTAAKG
ncbi:MAG: GNAT family N-acetyltransferase [Candidatus Eisenbacteria bacterium]|nr:GNAT family N-acetyltransferase [Candidatus Eisenbacteria bacterium]